MTNQSAGSRRGGGAAQQAERRSRPVRQDDRVECEQSAADLRESERLFRTTFDRAVVGIAHTSPEGRWLSFNRRLCDLLGYTRAELAARTFQDVTHPDDLDASLACLRRLLAGERDAGELEKRYIRKDGAQVWVHLTISLVRTPAGAPDYFIAMVQDITERKRLEQERARLYAAEQDARCQAEAALALARVAGAQATERAERLRTILETMADGVAVYDLGRVVRVAELVPFGRRRLRAARRAATTGSGGWGGPRTVMMLGMTRAAGGRMRRMKGAGEPWRCNSRC